MDKIEKFYTYLLIEKNYSRHTVIAYREDLRDFFSFIQKNVFNDINDEVLRSINYEHIQEWVIYRSKVKNLSNRSNARALSAIKSLFKFLNKRESIVNNSASRIQTPKIDKILPRTVSNNNFFKIVESIPSFEKEMWMQKRDLALTTLIYGTGLRISEALNITSDSFIKKDQIKVLGKGNKERIVFLLPIIVLMLEDYVLTCPFQYKMKEYFFISNTGKQYSPRLFQKLIQNVRRTLNLPENVTPHAFRHSFATELLNAGADLRSIQELLGHKNIASTQVYTHLNYVHLLDVYKRSVPVK